MSRSASNKKNLTKATENKYIEEIQTLKKKYEINAGWTGVAVLMLALMTLISLYLVLAPMSYTTEENIDETVTEEETDVVTQVISSIQRHILIHDTDDAVVADIVDIDKVRENNPEFYKDARNGDKLVVVDGKAIIYRPEDDVIIAIAPVLMDNGSGDEENEQMIYGIVMLNGTNNLNALDEGKKWLEDKWADDNSTYKLVKSEVAPSDYPVSILYDRTENGDGKVIADMLGVAYSKNIPDVLSYDVDFIIVLGADMF